MKLKQLLGVLMLSMAASGMAAAAGSQLAQVSAKQHDGATVVTIRATSAFTHTEYRPSENLLLLDLSGVSAAKFDGKAHLLQAPNVVGYKITEYKASSGANVARVELTLAPGVGVSLADASNSVLVKLSAKGSGVAEAAAPSPTPAAVATTATAPSAKPATIQHVGFVAGKNGGHLEITASAAITPQAMKLSQPDRIVIDLPNAVPVGRHEIAVNRDAIKSVRVSRYQLSPPATRIVVDLKDARDFEIKPVGHKLLVNFRQTAAKAETPVFTPAPAVTASVETPKVEAASTAPAAVIPAVIDTTKSSNLVLIEPTFKPKEKPSERAADAATKFAPSHNDLTAPVSASLATPATLNFMSPQAATTNATGGNAPKKYTGEPISVNLKDVDLKDFFRLIHEISGLNVVLDPGVHGTVTLVLDDVPWDQALDIVLQNNGLDRQLDGNVLRIATVDTIRKEAEAKRAQLDAVALAVNKVTVVRFLSYAHAKDVVPTLKKFISARGEIIADDRTNSLIIDDIPATIPKVDDLLAKLDRKTPEVEIEARVVSANRKFAREIGTQFGFGWGNRPSAVGGVQSAGLSPLANSEVPNPLYFVGSGGGSSTGRSIPLFSNLAATKPTSGLSFLNADTNFRLDFVLTMAESRGLLKVLSRPRVITQNNVQAVMRQGVRVPVVTAQQLGGPPTVTYIDAFLRMTVTPQITSEATIFLNVDVENTQIDPSIAIQGNPALDTQQATTQVLVTDGGTVVIGGVITTTNSINIEQVPLLGNIPFLGELFKHRTVSTSTQELIFFITPKIIQT